MTGSLLAVVTAEGCREERCVCVCESHSRMYSLAHLHTRFLSLCEAKWAATYHSPLLALDRTIVPAVACATEKKRSRQKTTSSNDTCISSTAQVRSSRQAHLQGQGGGVESVSSDQFQKHGLRFFDQEAYWYLACVCVSVYVCLCLCVCLRLSCLSARKRQPHPGNKQTFISPCGSGWGG